MLIDPNKAPLRASPREPRDLAIAANNAYVISFDNLSSLAPWLSDMIAQIATTGSFGTRQLYTDDEEKLFDAQRPVLINGIDNVIFRGDLADRALQIRLNYIPDKEKRVEGEFWGAFQQAQPRILGALLTAVSHGLKELPNVKLDSLPRMADFFQWATACEIGLWKPGTFAAAYYANRHTAVADIIESSLIATALNAFLDDRDGEHWTGSMSELLKMLTLQLDDEQKKDKYWPRAANKLSNLLTRLAPDLRKVGIRIADSGHDPETRRRVVTISRTPPVEAGEVSFGSFGSFETTDNKPLRDSFPKDPKDPKDRIPTSKGEPARERKRFHYRDTPETRKAFLKQNGFWEGE
jgi:hypothetical protein